MISLGLGVVLLVGGLCAGFLTGLLGIGGGVVMVPLLYQILLYQGHSTKAAFTTAVATSLATIIFSGSFSAYGYYKRGLLQWRLLFWTGAGALLGAWGGAHLMLASNDEWVRLGFGLFLWLVAAAMYLPKAPLRPHDHVPSGRYNAGLLVVGVCMGLVSSLFGVGGGALLVPALVIIFGIVIHNAVATATGMIVFTALFGTATYISLGWHDPLAPGLGLGWIHLPALMLLVPAALFATRYGIKAALSLSREGLRQALVVFLLVIGARFVFF